jgi:hypothetical protein
MELIACEDLKREASTKKSQMEEYDKSFMVQSGVREQFVKITKSNQSMQDSSVNNEMKISTMRQTTSHLEGVVCRGPAGAGLHRAGTRHQPSRLLSLVRIARRRYTSFVLRRLISRKCSRASRSRAERTSTSRPARRARRTRSAVFCAPAAAAAAAAVRPNRRLRNSGA